MRIRPSELLAIQDEYLAYCLDEVVMTFGTYVKNELESVKGKNEKEIEGRRLLVLRRLLSGEGPKFREPVATK